MFNPNICIMTKTRRWPSLLLAAFTVLSFGACEDWGQMDPPAGTDVYPKLEQVYSETFDEGITAESMMLFAYNEGDVPTVVADEEREAVLHMPNGYARLFNPLTNYKAQNGVSLTFWVKQALFLDEETEEPLEEDLDGALFSFQNINGTQNLYMTANGYLKYDGVDGEWESVDLLETKTGMLNNAGEWHYVAIIIKDNGYSVFVDGKQRIDKLVPSSEFPFSKVVQFMAGCDYIYLGYGSEVDTKEMWMDDLTIYRNQITKKEIKRPSSGAEEELLEKFQPVYFNGFDDTSDLTIKGGGSFENIGGKFGNVFQNVSGGMRTNYLLLPSDLLSHSASTQEMSIGFWVNRGNETSSDAYGWSPMFMAYAAPPAADGTNTLPMFACQYRGVLQVNCNGWSDFTDAINVAGANKLWHFANDWLADGEWHYYTVTLTATNAKVYIDGEIANEWEVTGSGDNNVIAGLFSNGSDLNYICLGGNQAWNWADNDPGFWFDDIAVYDRAISQAQIKENMKAKGSVYYNSFEFGAADATIVGEGTFIKTDDEDFGMVFSNVGGAQRSNYLLLPEGVFSHAKETQATTISVWVNRGNETTSSAYMWSPLFTAYGAAPAGNSNTFPMLACQYRGVLQINCGGWCDFTDDINVNGVNGVYHDATDWLADGEWHLYTAVFTPNNAKVYFDGVLKNQWNVSGEGDNNVIAGLFNNGAELKYVCLGGNQAWTWADNDPGFWFDDMAIYNIALSESEILEIVNAKKQ